MHTASFSLLLTAAVVLAGCSKKADDTPQPTTTYGAEMAIGNGAGRGYVRNDAGGNPTEIGLRLTEAALTGLPVGPMPTMYDMTLPAAAGNTPYNHISFGWNPLGHEPFPIYGAPHFDAHFYIQPLAAQHAIVLDDPRGDIFPATAMLPTGYATPPNVVPGRTVPMMGRHWTDPGSPEYQPGGRFSCTFVYGTFDGHVTFMEPMFTLAMLTTAVDFSAPVRQPQQYENPGKYYPTQYVVRYDATTREYVVALTELVKR